MFVGGESKTVLNMIKAQEGRGDRSTPAPHVDGPLVLQV